MTRFKQFEIKDDMRRYMDRLTYRDSSLSAKEKQCVDWIQEHILYAILVSGDYFDFIADMCREVAKNIPNGYVFEKIFTQSYWNDRRIDRDILAHTAARYLAEGRPFYRCYPSFTEQALKLFETNAFALGDILTDFSLDGSTTVALEMDDSVSIWGVTILETKTKQPFLVGFVPDDYNAGRHHIIPLIGTQTLVTDSLAKNNATPLVRKHVTAMLAAIICRDDPEIAQQVVLSRFNGEVNERTTRISKQRGVNGVEFGKVLETSPSAHYRRPHLALFHTGKGRTEPKILLRKGCFVLGYGKSIPEGFHADDV